MWGFLGFVASTEISELNLHIPLGPNLPSAKCSQNELTFKFLLASSPPAPGCVFPDLGGGEEYKKKNEDALLSGNGILMYTFLFLNRRY